MNQTVFHERACACAFTEYGLVHETTLTAGKKLIDLKSNGSAKNDIVEPPLTDPPKCGQPPYNGQHDRHRLILACVLYIFNLRETDNCNFSVPDNGHSARPRMTVAVQKKPLRADRLKATPSRTRGVCTEDTTA